MGSQNAKPKAEIHVVHHYIKRGNSEMEPQQHEELDDSSLIHGTGNNGRFVLKGSVSDIWRECDTGYFEVDPSTFEYNTGKPENKWINRPNLVEPAELQSDISLGEKRFSWSDLSENSWQLYNDEDNVTSSSTCSCSTSLDNEDSTGCCISLCESLDKISQTGNKPVDSGVEALKPVEFVDYFEVDPCGDKIFPTVWHNVMWREEMRRVDLTIYSTNSMATTSASSPIMFGPPKIPQTPSKAINNMLQTKCGKPVPNKVKFLLASVICHVFHLITMLYNQIHKDKARPSQRMWMASCGVVGAASIILAVLIYQIVVSSAFLMHAILYYGCICLALIGAGLCVSGVVFFDKEGQKEDFEKEQ